MASDKERAEWRARTPALPFCPKQHSENYKYNTTARGALRRTMTAPETIAEAVPRFIEDDSQTGQVVEERPTGVKVIEPRRAPQRRS
jgi:hypothetical protein